MVIDFQGLLRTGLITFLARARDKVGFAAAREGARFAYRRRVAVPPEVLHAVDKNIYLLNAALDSDEEYLPPRFRDNPEAAAAADELLARHGLDAADKLLAVAPAARWESKKWPASFFIDCLTRILAVDSQLRVWLLGAADERAVGEPIVAAVDPERVRNLMGETSLAVMLELLKKSRLLLTNDSGPMHLAAAVGLPTAALFGPTDPDKTGPYGEGHRVFRTSIDCAPCFRRQCPLPRQLCLDDVVTPEGVADRIVAQLEPDAS